MRLPVAVPLESRDGTVTRDSKTKNAIIEAKGDKLFLRKRPGLTDVGLVLAGTAQLLAYWDDEVVAVIGDFLNRGTVGTSPTWNPNDKGGSVTLSGSNLIATVAGASAHSVRANANNSSGKWYWEITVTTHSASGNGTIGVVNASASMTASITSTANGLGINLGNGNIIFNGNAVGAISACTTGDIISIAHNADTGAVTFRKNNANATTISGANVPTGSLYPAVGGNANANDVVLTANFGASAFTYSVPSGFSELDTGFTGVIVSASTDLNPTDEGLHFSAQDNGSNAPTSLLMFKNATQAWTLNTSGTVTQITDADYPGEYTVTLTSLTRSGTTATATTAFDTNFQVGASVTIAGASQADYNGAKTITAVTASVTTGGSAELEVSITRSGTTATATARDAPHGFTNGQTVTISGSEQAEYNGDKVITWISGTQFSFTVTVVSGNTVSPATGTILYGVVERAGSGVLSGGTITVEMVNHGFTTGMTINAWSQAHNETLTDAGGEVITVTDADTFTFPEKASGAQVYTRGGLWVVGKAISVSSVTSSGGTATVTTSSAHNITSRDLLVLFGANQTYYNVNKVQVTVPSSTTFTYPLGPGAIADTPASPATGTIKAKGKPVITAASFTFEVANSPATPATGTITAKGGRRTVPGIAYLDGYFCVADEDGVIYNSAEDAPADWHALEYFTALAETGAAKVITKQLNYGVLLKEWSTEFFYNAGNEPPGSPLSPVENLHTLVGCANGWSLADVGGSLLWIAQEKKQTGRSVYLMAGTQQVKVSTPDIDRILNGDDLETVHAYGVNLAGHRLYVLTLEDTGITLVYDLDSKIWGEWTSYTIASTVSVSSITRSGTTATVTTSTAHGLSDGDPVKIAGSNQSDYNGLFQAFVVSSTVFTIEVANSPVTPATGTITAAPFTESYFKMTKYAAGDGRDLVLHTSDGHLYEFSASDYQDDDVPVNVHTRSIRLDGGSTQRKPMPRIGVIGDSVASFCAIRWSDDDCTTFSAYRRVVLDDTRPEIRRCGAFERRTIELRHLANTKLHLEALEL